MSLNTITCDIKRDTVTADDGGGETAVAATIHALVEMTISYPNKSAVNRHELAGSPGSGPGPLTRSDRVAFIEPWDTSLTVLVNDEVVPNPTLDYLPASMKVVAVRPYEDGAEGELQLDLEDVA